MTATTTTPQPARSMSALRAEVAEMVDLADYDGVRGEHLSALFENLFFRSYGVHAIDAKRDRGVKFAEEHFNGDAREAAKYIRWIFHRAAKERAAGRERRYAFGLIFSAALVSDYLVARHEKQPADAAEDEQSTTADAARTSGEPAPEDAGDGLRRGDHVELAERLIRELQTDEHAPVSAFGALHPYDPAIGVWQPVDETQLSRRIQGFAGTPVEGKRNGLTVRAGDVSGTIKLAHARVADDRFFDGASRGLAFADGFARLDNDGMVTLLPHSPDNRARFAYPFAFGEKHPRKKFIAFMRSLFREDDDAKAKIRVVREFGGAALFGIAPRYQRCLVAQGGGNNGKSAALDVMAKVFPRGSTCAVPPQNWGADYKRTLLGGKLLNVVSELPENDIIASEAFKAIVTGDPIDARQIYGAAYTLIPTAGHVFAANALPGTSDQSDGFWRRFLVLTFTRAITDEEKNPRIAEELIETEHAGIVQWFVEGAAALVQRGAYDEPISHVAAMAAWRRNADQVSAFLDECTRPTTDEDDERGTSSSALYDLYTRWAKKSGHRPVSSTKFGLRLDKLGKGSTHTRKGNVVPVVPTLTGWART